MTDTATVPETDIDWDWKKQALDELSENGPEVVKQMIAEGDFAFSAVSVHETEEEAQARVGELASAHAGDPDCLNNYD